jgi:hypothetical protein
MKKKKACMTSFITRTKKIGEFIIYVNILDMNRKF